MEKLSVKPCGGVMGHSSSNHGLTWSCCNLATLKLVHVIMCHTQPDIRISWLRSSAETTMLHGQYDLGTISNRALVAQQGARFVPPG